MSSISKAYCSVDRDVDGIQAKVVPVSPLAMVATVFRLVASPFFRRMVTGPDASLQVRFTGLPTVIPTKVWGGMVNLAALVSAKAAAATRASENCILKDLKDLKVFEL